MPDLLQPPWSHITPLIPVADHSVAVDAAPWQRDLIGHGLQHHHQAIFGGNQNVRLSRGKLLTHIYPNQEQKCLEIFMWGWPSRNRGNLRNAFLQNLPAIAAAAALNQPWPDYYAHLHNLGGLGISTITKLAYFHGHPFGNLQSLILDSRIMDVLVAGRWQGLAMPNLTYNNASQNYTAYLQAAANIAGALGCTPDHVEFLLFSCGNVF